MQSKAATVAEYLASLPEDRRKAVQAVRKVILDNLDSQYEERMSYGMIGYAVPHSVYPPGYHCDPRQPLPFAGLASQKGHMSLYLGCLYGSTNMLGWFQTLWNKTGKKLDMGKACIRFKRVEDLALDVIAEAIRRVPAKVYIEQYEIMRAQTEARPVRGKPDAKASTKAAAKSGAKSSAKSAVAKPASKRSATRATTKKSVKKSAKKTTSAKTVAAGAVRSSKKSGARKATAKKR